MNALTSVITACHLAARQHRAQTRKDPARTPYINHPIEVAAILSTIGRVDDPNILAAAILHDTVEDTGLTLAEIQSQFGPRVASLVAECTDDKSLPQARRKQLQIEHAPHMSPDAKLIKLADKIANVTDIVSVEWPIARKLDYLNWAQAVVRGLRDQNPALDAAFDAAVARARSATPDHPPLHERQLCREPRQTKEP